MSCLTCPQDANLGDVALQLQKTALEAERCIFAQEHLLRAGVNRPTIIQTTTLTQTITVNTSTAIDGGDITFSSSPLNSSWAGFFSTGGIFACGATFNATAVGVATDNSIRLTTLQTNRNLTGPVTNQVHFTQYETTASGGVDVSIHGVFACDPNDWGKVMFFHGNTGSSVNIAAGAIFWATWLGDLSAVRTVNA